MSQTVSFVVRDELAEWLESKAEAEMKTVSSVCQEIVAGAYQTAKPKEPNWTEEALDGTELTSPLRNPPFSNHPSAWYEPSTQDPQEIVAVRIPDSANVSEDRRYYKTFDGAAKAIKRWYE